MKQCRSGAHPPIGQAERLVFQHPADFSLHAGANPVFADESLYERG
jgi:hypothetical protein